MAFVLAAAACGEEEKGDRLGTASEARATGRPATLPNELIRRARATGLTHRVSQGIARACEALSEIASERSDVRAVVCPPLVPAGPARHVRRGLLPGANRDAPGAIGWTIEAMSPSIGPAGETHFGHWRVASNSRVGHRYLGFRPTAAHTVEVRKLAGIPIRVYEMPAYPLGGVDGGHVVLEWAQAGTILHMSVHGYEQRLLAERMAEGLIHEVRKSELRPDQPQR